MGSFYLKENGKFLFLKRKWDVLYITVILSHLIPTFQAEVGVVGGQGGEEKAAPFLRRIFRQPAVGLVEARMRLHARRGREPAVEFVGPMVIGADDAFAPALTLHEDSTAMATDIGKDADFLILAPDR